MKISTVALHTLLLTLVLQSRAFGQNDLNQLSYLTRVYVNRSFEFSTCKTDVESVIAQLPAGQQAIIGGPAGIITNSSNQSSCDAQFVLATSAPLDPAKFSQALGTKGFKSIEWVGNENATYIGYIASGFRADGSYVDCIRKNLDNEPTHNWYQTFSTRHSMLNQVAGLPLNEKRQWIQRHFNCGPLESLKTVGVSFDVTNKMNCSFSPNNLKSCFILRGLATKFINVAE